MTTRSISGEVPVADCIHVTGALSATGMGVSRAVWEMAAAQHSASAGNRRISLIGLRDAGWTGEPPFPTDVPRAALPYRPLLNLGFSPALARELKLQATTEIDGLRGGPRVIHSHGMWMYQNWEAARIARKRGLPLIVSPHGMMCPWSFRSGGLKKKPVFALLEKPNLRRAACLLAASDKEARDIEAFGLGVPVATIPFGLNPGEFPHPARPEPGPVSDARESLFSSHPELEGRRLLLFLGRLHPVKAPDHLLSAMLALLVDGAAGDWQLVFAGPDDPPMQAMLARQAEEAGAGDRVTFTGALFGPAKLALLRASSLLALCSHDENFGYVVPEALACGTPAVATENLPWGILKERGAGWISRFGPEGLAETLGRIFALPESDLRAAGMRGRDYIETEMNWTAVAARMLELYDWTVRGDALRPSFVRLPDT